MAVLTGFPVEWETKPTTAQGWEYNTGHFGIGGTIDTAPAGGSSASGGSAFRCAYPPNLDSNGNPIAHPTSIGGGTANYNALNHPELYMGHWVKWSSNWVWNSVGSKVNYFWAQNPSTTLGSNAMGTLRISPRAAGLVMTVDFQLHTPDTGLVRALDSAPYNFPRNRWCWLETHLKVNPIGNVWNGICEVWIDGFQLINYRTCRLVDITGNTIGNFLHSPEWGGGGQPAFATTMYCWFDHTVISTTPIGIPGGSVPPPDTTPPSVPTGLAVV